MIESEDQLQTMVNQAEQRERKARRNALLFTLVPILVAIGLVAFTGWQVQKASQDVAASKATLNLTKKTQGAAEAALNNAEIGLSEANQQITVAQVTITENSRALADLQKQATQAQKDLTTITIQLADAQKELDTQQAQLETQQAQIGSLKIQVDEYADELKMASVFESYRYDGNLMTVDKMIESMSEKPGIMKLWERIKENMNVPWKLYGTNLKEGVNSPTYVALMLGLLPEPASFSIDQGTLMEFLPIQRVKPQIGDVVYYAEGLTFFYFEDDELRPLVIGMTPFGVLDLRYDYDTPKGIGRPKY